MKLTLEQKQCNIIDRYIKKCQIDKRYYITLIAKNLWNTNNSSQYEFYMNIFKNEKKVNSYTLRMSVYDKYETSGLFERISSSKNHVVMGIK